MQPMATRLHLTRVAYGCDGLAMLEARQAGRSQNGMVRINTRYRPKRSDVTIGGSLFWIIQHRLVARSPIVGYAVCPDGRTDILLGDQVIPVRPTARRSHQGWRYLEAVDAPADLAGLGDAADLPPALLRTLADLCLV